MRQKKKIVPTKSLLIYLAPTATDDDDQKGNPALSPGAHQNNSGVSNALEKPKAACV